VSEKKPQHHNIDVPRNNQTQVQRFCRTDHAYGPVENTNIVGDVRTMSAMAISF